MLHKDKLDRDEWAQKTIRNRKKAKSRISIKLPIKVILTHEVLRSDIGVQSFWIGPSVMKLQV
jgi:hypothetical protein